MQIEIKNPEYLKVVEEECAECDRIIAKMLEFNCLKARIKHNAVINANVVYENVGTLNVTKSQAKALQKMTDKKVREIIKDELQEDINVATLFKLSK